MPKPGKSRFVGENWGREGVMRTVFAITLDGMAVHLDGRDVPGRFSDSPHGSLGTELDKLWIPSGYRYTLSELSEFQHHLNRRDAIYRIFCKALGLGVLREAYEAHIFAPHPLQRMQALHNR